MHKYIVAPDTISEIVQTFWLLYNATKPTRFAYQIITLVAISHKPFEGYSDIPDCTCLQSLTRQLHTVWPYTFSPTDMKSMKMFSHMDQYNFNWGQG